MEIENFLYDIYSIYQNSKDLPNKERQKNFEVYLDEIESYGMPFEYIQTILNSSSKDKTTEFREVFGDILIVCNIRIIKRIEISLNSMWKNLNVQ